MMWRLKSFLAIFWLLAAAHPAQAESCSAAISDINFGAVNVRAGAVNQTSGTIQITCTGAIVSAVGVCVRFGPGNGGAGSNNSPRYMRRGDGSILLYELRPNGNGNAFGTLNEIYALVPIILGSGSVSVPFYADIVSTGVSVGTGSYSSVFSGAEDIELSYGIVNCNILGNTASVPSFEVSAEVVASCEIDVGTLNFGNISSSITQPVYAETAINVRCTDTTPYVLSLDMGGGSGVTDPANRKLSNGPYTLNYGLYSDGAHVQAWGNLPGNSVGGTGAGLNQVFSVYGRIHSGQSAFVGVYQDSVLVTVAY